MLFSSPARAYTWTFEPSTKVVTAEGGVYDKADLRAFSESITMPSDDMSASIVLDLSAVEFFPSVAISILAAQQRRATSDDVRVRLVAAPETIPHRVLTITGIEFDEAL